MTETIRSRYGEVFDKVNTFSNIRAWQKGKTRIIVVTKRQPIEACLEVIDAGATNIGENYLEEANEKYNCGIVGNLNLHMIGHLQSRKAKLLDPLFSFMHTIDRTDIASKVSRLYEEKNKSLKVLLEINFTDEISKSGFEITNDDQKEKFHQSFTEILNLPGISICGLMTMGYFPSTPERNREVFRKCRILFEEINNRYSLRTFNELSMGTSGDYLTAIQEGATFVRIGELIMGKRMEMKI
jgi:PLP dependent protein